MATNPSMTSAAFSFPTDALMTQTHMATSLSSSANVPNQSLFPFNTSSSQTAVSRSIPIPQDQAPTSSRVGAYFQPSQSAPLQPLFVDPPVSVDAYTSLAQIRQRYPNGLSLYDIALISLQLFNLLKNIAKDGKIHVSLSPNTILFNEKLELRIVNGKTACAVAENGVAIQSFPYWVEEKSLGYLAPEVILGQPLSQQSSWWSVGIILVELFTNKTLITNCSHKQHILESQLLIDPSPTQRSFLDEIIMKHAISRRENEYNTVLFLNLVKSFLKRDPSLRMNPGLALQHLFFKRINSLPFASPPAQGIR
jgi:serine/threonine protein kinase